MRTVLLVAAALVLMSAAVLASTQITLHGRARQIAVTLHSLAFVLGFGAVLSVMFCGLRVTLGNLQFLEAAKTAVTIDPGIWLGFMLMVITGAFLRPDLSSPWMLTKLLLALISCVNGILALPSMQSLLTLPPQGGLEVVPTPLRLQLLVQTAISQASWWTMAGISYIELRS